MSRIDTSFSATERQDLLDEVRHHLPAFLSAASTERYDPAGDVRDLLNLDASDLRRVVAAHLALTPQVRQFTSTLAQGMRHPRSEGVRVHEDSPVVRGSVDWGRTIRFRAARGAVDQRFVLMRNTRQFDLPENRALLWAIDRLSTELDRVRTSGDQPADSWQGEIDGMRTVLAAARQVHWIRGLKAERPTTDSFRRMRASRSALYANHLPELIEAIRRWCDEPTPEDITELLAARFFEPSRDWQLFEVVVALRLARKMATRASGRRKTHLLGQGRRPYATYSVGPDVVRLWYQSWPRDSGGSNHRRTARRFKIAAGSPRPDIVVEVQTPSDRWAVVIECKASSSPSYLSEGIFQLLGYLMDRPALFSGLAPGWLVAPPSQAFEDADPSDLLVRVVSSNQVADLAAALVSAAADD